MTKSSVDIASDVYGLIKLEHKTRSSLNFNSCPDTGARTPIGMCGNSIRIFEIVFGYEKNK